MKHGEVAVHRAKRSIEEFHTKTDFHPRTESQHSSSKHKLQTDDQDSMKRVFQDEDILQMLEQLSIEEQVSNHLSVPPFSRTLPSPMPYKVPFDHYDQNVFINLCFQILCRFSFLVLADIFPGYGQGIRVVRIPGL
jgi:hypothetical protein